MKRITLALVALLMGLGLAVVPTQGAQAFLGESTACKYVDVTFGQDPYVCLTIGYTRISSTRMELDYMRLKATPANSLESPMCINGQVFYVTASNGSTSWSTPDSNANVNNGPPCERTWDFADRTVNTSYFNAYYQGVIKAGDSGLNTQFSIRAYTP